jgi:ADP-ribose pyrophosphatase
MLETKVMDPKVTYRTERFACPYFRVEEVGLEYPDGRSHTYFLEHGIDFVSIVSQKDAKFLMVKQFRFPVSDSIIEFPAGGINTNEDKRAAAAREFIEETGYGFSEMNYLGPIHPLSARSSTVGHVFAATNIHKMTSPKLDPTEFGLEHLWLSESDFHNLCFSKNVDAVTLASWALYRQSALYMK